MRELPANLGPFEGLQLISRSDNVVAEAIDARDGRRVALKIFDSGAGLPLPEQQARRARFDREARIGKMVSHPNLLLPTEVSEEGGVRFLVMPFVPGHTLAEEIARGRLGETRIVEIGCGVLQGLKALHERAIVHRDVKPENVHLREGGGILLGDVGMARLLSEPSGEKEIVGTPEYMSPEQTAGAPVDPRSDLFSLAATLLEAFTGSPPFQGDTIFAVGYAVTYKNPPRPSEMSEGLWTALTRALAKRQGSRFGSADEMIQALQVSRD